ncbi:MAG: hypothetical protein K2W96_02470 [Gemmataceae bacterium]|nr:hypothetical protein [Gemmataceae bacterium]
MLALLVLVGAAPPVPDSLLGAARRREEEFRVFRARVVRRESLTRKADGVARSIVLETTARAVLDGPLSRLDSEQAQWQLPVGTVLRWVEAEATDGEFLRKLCLSGPMAGQAFIRRKERPEWRWLEPLKLHVRGSDALSSYASTGRWKLIGGHACLEHAHARHPASLLYADPACGWSIRASESWGRGTLSVATVIDLAPGGPSGWMPASWTRTVFLANGKTSSSSSSTVAEWSVAGPVPGRDLQLSFAPGSLVSDQRGPEPVEAEAQPDGTLKPLPPPPAPGPFAGRELPPAGDLVLMGLFAGLLLGLMWLIFRKRPEA